MLTLTFVTNIALFSKRGVSCCHGEALVPEQTGKTHLKNTIMPGDRSCSTLLLPHRSSDLRKKKKERNKAFATDPELKERPVIVSPTPQPSPQDPGQTELPELRATSKKTSNHCSHGASKTKERRKDSRSLFAAAPTASDNKVPAYLSELGVQARESLRWEGVLQDPQEEAKRLERYRANRRQRYITHREAAFKETQQTLREAELKTSAD
ncbi:hypothetical protein AMECASPLE_011706 [Ameca splendens]|uniref:Protein LIAT1 n=1 Tax=Ameca splendens TaxID=208324 RepID=A0ABV0YN69_9TELE